MILFSLSNVFRDSAAYILTTLVSTNNPNINTTSFTTSSNYTRMSSLSFLTKISYLLTSEKVQSEGGKPKYNDDDRKRY